MISSQFNTELQILEVYYEGNIKLNDLIDFWNEVHNNKSQPRNLHLLIDATRAQYELDADEFSELVKAMAQHVSAYELIKAAFIQSKPKETAYSMLLDQRVTVPNYHHAIFYTREAALEWLL